MWWSRAGAVLVLGLVVGLAPGGVAATPVSADPARGARADHHATTGPDVRPDGDLRGDVVVPASPPGVARLGKWPGTKIRYHETIPRKWQWSLDRAIDHWNSSGGRMKFVKTSKRRSQLVIRYGETWGADGVATLGYTRGAFVHLSPSYKNADEFDPSTRVWVGRLFTHELGHVLGFDHTGGQCSLMYPVYDFGLCPPLPDDKPGYYFCRWIDKPLLRRFVRMYGGSPRRPSRLCLIEPLPGQLRGVAFTGGQAEGKPVRIAWRPPDRVRERTKVRIGVWQAGDCSKDPDFYDDFFTRAPGESPWVDPTYGQGGWCYRIWIENRYGAARPAFTERMQRYAPVPDAPDVGPLTWRADEAAWRLTWSAPPDTTLRVMRDDGDPGSCRTTYDEFEADWPDALNGDSWRVHPFAQRECLTFFAVTDWGTVSGPTSVQVEIPGPDATPTVGQVSEDPGDPFFFTVPASLADDRYRLGVEVLAGACPAQPPADAEWWDGWENEPGVWGFYAEVYEAGAEHCAMFAAVDDSFWPPLTGPVVMRSFAPAG